MTTTFLAIDPAGRTHKRTSKDRTYTHTVVALPDYEAARTRAGKIEAYDAEAYRYALEVIAQGVNHRNAPLDYSQGYDNRKVDAAKTAEWVAEKTTQIAGHDTALSYQDAQAAARVAAVDAQEKAGYYTTWSNVGWCGRPDLAASLLRQTSAKGYWASAVVLAATVKGA